MAGALDYSKSVRRDAPATLSTADVKRPGNSVRSEVERNRHRLVTQTVATQLGSHLACKTQRAYGCVLRFGSASPRTILTTQPGHPAWARRVGASGSSTSISRRRLASGSWRGARAAGRLQSPTRCTLDRSTVAAGASGNSIVDLLLWRERISDVRRRLGQS